MRSGELSFLLSSLSFSVSKLEKREKRLQGVLMRKGYSVKEIHKNKYVYIWFKDGAKVRWRCLGRLDRVDLKELRDVSPVLEELIRVEEMKDKVRRGLEDLLKLLDGF